MTTGRIPSATKRFSDWNASTITIEKPTVYSVYKVSEGGFGQDLALTLLCGEGFRAELRGETDLIVFGGPRIQKRAAQLLATY